MRIAKFFTAGSFLIALFSVSFMFSLRGCLSAYDERFALPPVLCFTKDSKQILFSLVQYNETTSYSSEQGMVMKTFTNYYFIQINSGLTGEKIMDSKIKKRTGSKSVTAQVLGSANNYAWLYIDGLIAYDPFTLQKTADEKMIEEKNPLLTGKLPLESQYYHFSNEDGNIRFTATDGSLWLLNTASLLATPDVQQETTAVNIIQKAMQSKFQSLNQSHVSFNNLSINQDTVNGRWYGLYTQDEIRRLDASFFFNTVYGQDVRRQIYSAAINKEGNNFLISKASIRNIQAAEYFLDAGFLLNRKTKEIARITNPDGRLMVYKNQVGRDAKIMLCGISNNGTVMWRLNTNLAAWTDWVCNGNRTFITGNTNERNSSGSNVLLIVDLPTGNLNRFDYFTGKVSIAAGTTKSPN